MRLLSTIMIVVTLSLISLISCTPGTKYALREDDDYFSPHNDDYNYTQGLRLSGEIPDKTGSHEYSLQQTFYTPRHKKTKSILPGERPYAGYAAVGYKANWLRSGTVVDILGIDVGLVGPHAYAKQTQREFHKLIGQTYPAGWDNQLNDEPTVNLTAERKYRIVFNRSDIINTIGGNFGNLFDQGYFGSTYRIGHNLNADFYNLDTLFPRIGKEYDRLSYYAFFGVLGRVVGRNIFLDGNTFSKSYSVDKEPFVAEVRAGFRVAYDQYNLAYTLVRQTEEFKTEGSQTNFGEIALGIQW